MLIHGLDLILDQLHELVALIADPRVRGQQGERTDDLLHPLLPLLGDPRLLLLVALAAEPGGDLLHDRPGGGHGHLSLLRCAQLEMPLVCLELPVIGGGRLEIHGSLSRLLLHLCLQALLLNALLLALHQRQLLLQFCCLAGLLRGAGLYADILQNLVRKASEGLPDLLLDQLACPGGHSEGPRQQQQGGWHAARHAELQPLLQVAGHDGPSVLAEVGAHPTGPAGFSHLCIRERANALCNNLPVVLFDACQVMTQPGLEEAVCAVGRQADKRQHALQLHPLQVV
mmetsp:Transcript_27700/g.78324  ORF Transcript_27700/g.78324 Transcript_27700/m.78324 type:complete len:285 (-) Transcript_27700:706-1560(-)